MNEEEGREEEAEKLQPRDAGSLRDWQQIENYLAAHTTKFVSFQLRRACLCTEKGDSFPRHPWRWQALTC